VYGRIPGAQFANRSDVGAVWEVPCDKEVNMTFTFAGQKIPIHPLDTTVDLNLTNASGDKVCLGAVSTCDHSSRLTTAHLHRSINPSAPRSTIITTSSLECLSVRIFHHPHPLFLLTAFTYSSKRLYPHRLWRFCRRHLQHRQPLHSTPSHDRRPYRGPPRFREDSYGRERQRRLATTPSFLDG